VIEKSLGERIAELRKANGLTQEQLAEKAGYSVEFISLVERGLNAPSVAGLAKIAKALKVEVKDLFDFGKGGR
jgi:transcriptional regulator with XRE-family HTH domain